jgi:hypothetical protein
MPDTENARASVKLTVHSMAAGHTCRKGVDSRVLDRVHLVVWRGVVEPVVYKVRSRGIERLRKECTR